VIADRITRWVIPIPVNVAYSAANTPAEAFSPVIPPPREKKTVWHPNWARLAEAHHRQVSR